MAQQQGRGNGRMREKVKTGDFRLGNAILEGIVVKDGPIKRFSQRGNPWTEATILVGLYDGRQKKERDRPAFVRVKAFNELADVLDGFARRDRLHVAGALMIQVYEDRDGNLREAYEMHADHLSRERLPRLDELLANAGGARQGQDARDEGGWNDEDDRDGYDQRSGDEPDDGSVGDPWPSSPPQELTEDDIPL